MVFNQSDGLRPANWFLFMEEPAKKSMVARNASSLSWVVIVPVLSCFVNSSMKSGCSFNFFSNNVLDTVSIVFLKASFRLGSDNSSTAPWRSERSTSLPSFRIAFNEKVPPFSLASLNFWISPAIGRSNSVGSFSSP